ncbi:recombinase family protein [Streptomyces longwoodensis]|uniref:recombinase family protein n=1 Tax=Streptomyces longwoodensis TaxID=68231 RepID=UPI0033A12E25
MREICALLEAEGIRTKCGERWHPETVRQMLANSSDRPPTPRRQTQLDPVRAPLA